MWKGPENESTCFPPSQTLESLPKQRNMKSRSDSTSLATAASMNKFQIRKDKTRFAYPSFLQAHL